MSYPYTRNSLDVPDGSRKIFDNKNKVKAFKVLESEFTALGITLARDINPYLQSTPYNPDIVLGERVA